jgi:hypothetical protein
MTKEERVAYNREWRKKNPQYRREWNAKNRDRVNASQRKWCRKNPDKISISARIWKDKNPDKFKEGCRAWQRANPERIKAYVDNWTENHRAEKKRSKRLSYAVKCGHIIRPNKCDLCGKETNPDGHHPDQLNPDPLKVMWLCRKCHQQLHFELRQRQYLDQCLNCKWNCKTKAAPTLKLTCFDFQQKAAELGEKIRAEIK